MTLSPDFVQCVYERSSVVAMMTLADGWRQGDQCLPIDAIKLSQVVLHRLSALWWKSAHIREDRWFTEDGTDAVKYLRERIHETIILLRTGQLVAGQTLAIRHLLSELDDLINADIKAQARRGD